jgi:osmoprotectant transport system ATP-binding protein
MIEFDHVKKSFDGNYNVLDDITFNVMPGECLVLLGSSGSGKTTTLKMINRLLEPSAGIIRINGQDVATLEPVQLRRSIGYVFQGIGLFPHFTVSENIQIVLQLQKFSKQKQIQQSHYFLEQVNLDPSRFAARYPAELSGGQQQRVGVARALATHSDILLMDEPFGALDAINRVALQNEILTLKKKIAKTIVFVTHDIYEALRLGDRIAVINQGKLEQIGTRKEIMQKPATDFVHELFSQAVHQLKEFMDVLYV